MSEWSGGDAAEFDDRIRGSVQHSDYLGLRQQGGQTGVPTDGLADVPGTMPNGRRPGKRRNGSRRLAADSPDRDKSDNMGGEPFLPTARSPDMSDAAAPARVTVRQRRAPDQKQAAKRYVSRLTRNTLA